MDVAYDHIQEESFAEAEPAKAGENKDNRLSTDINSEFQEAYKAISSSPWAATLGGFLGSVKKQVISLTRSAKRTSLITSKGEQYYAGARQEYANASEQATKGISSVIGRARGLSLNQPDVAESAKSAESSETITEHPDKPESLPADILKEAGGILSLFKTEATKRLKDFERAEDAADEALLKFGTNIRNFLRDAVTVAPPPEGAGEEGSSKVLFESKDSDGKRVIHTTRFDAQLHVIHSSLDSFLKDPVSPEWSKWAEKFDIDAKTDAIAKDLEQHEELRKAMEKLVPEKVEYAQFWKRYYFLRFVIESEEKRRREMLKGLLVLLSDKYDGLTKLAQLLPNRRKRTSPGMTMTLKSLRMTTKRKKTMMKRIQMIPMSRRANRRRLILALQLLKGRLSLPPVKSPTNPPRAQLRLPLLDDQMIRILKPAATRRMIL